MGLRKEQFREVWRVQVEVTLMVLGVSDVDGPGLDVKYG